MTGMVTLPAMGPLLEITVTLSDTAGQATIRAAAPAFCAIVAWLTWAPFPDSQRRNAPRQGQALAERGPLMSLEGAATMAVPERGLSGEVLRRERVVFLVETGKQSERGRESEREK
jgi:hypothetical protein